MAVRPEARSDNLGYEGDEVEIKTVSPRKGMQFVKRLAGDEVCVAMTQFKDVLYLATNKHVYFKDDDGIFIQMVFEVNSYGKEGS